MNKTLAIGTLIVMIAQIVVPIWAQFFFYSLGQTPEKHIELTQIGPINSGWEFSLGNSPVPFTMSMKHGDRTYDNVVIVSGILRNTGSTPILPTDFVEKLTAHVADPWKIIDVGDGIGNVKFRWNRLDGNTFQAEPTLLNPGDSVWTTLYLTNKDSSATTSAPLSEQVKPEVEWNVRIVNLKSFTTPPTFLEKYKARFWGVVVQLSGWSFIFTMADAILLNAIYLHFSAASGYLKKWNWKSFILLLGISVLSFCAAESTATLIFGNQFSDFDGINWWLNLPPVLIGVVVFSWLLYRSFKLAAEKRNRSADRKTKKPGTVGANQPGSA
ncbi:MAG TPA: hypothetical protein VGI81_09700 [Tepidisphaeraceae bacterium]|jgi:hypothetical protein